MASLTPILDMQLDNPMVTGYGFPAAAPAVLDPIEIAYCPRCRIKWIKMPEEMADNLMRPWEADLGRVIITAPAHPIGARYCRACALQAATINDLISYIETHKLQQSALEYAIIAGYDWEHKLDPEWAEWMWDVMKVKLYETGRMRDFVQEEHGEPFVDWMMERSRK